MFVYAIPPPCAKGQSASSLAAAPEEIYGSFTGKALPLVRKEKLPKSLFCISCISNVFTIKYFYTTVSPY